MKCPNCGVETLSDSKFCHNCASPLTDSGAKTIKAPTFEIQRGNLFAGRYEIIEELGQGGMGKVFKVYDRKINEVIALKLIRPEISVNEKAIERFKNELKFARKISHRNICRMYDLGEEGFYHYITMEFVQGEDLKRFIRRAGSLTSGKSINIARQVAEGLAEAHNLGVIHRDLKPQNIMIDQDGNAKIMDFGIARFIDTDRMTGSGVMIGTPEYMSPEQVELTDVDKRADLYSLGIVLYEMVTGKVPFEGATPLSIAMKHKSEAARNVRELNAQVSAALAAIIAKCMEKGREKRFQSAEALIEELGRANQELSTAERVVPKKEVKPPPKQARRPRLQKLLLPGAAAGLIIVAAIVGSRFIGKTSGSLPPPQIPEQKTEMAEVNVSANPAPQPAPVVAREKKAAKVGNTRETKEAAPPKKQEQKPVQIPPEPEITEAELSSANLAMARLAAAKSLTQKQGAREKTFFYDLAEAREKEAVKSLSQKRLTEARALAAVSEWLYRFCTAQENDEDRVADLKRFTEDIKDEIDLKQIASTPKEKLYNSAADEEKKAGDLLAKKDVEGAAKSYVNAVLAYEKILLTLQAAKKKLPSP